MKNIFNVVKGSKRVVITMGENISIVISWKKHYSFKIVRENNVILEIKLK